MVYTTTFVTEEIRPGRERPIIKYRTTFGGPVIDHDRVLDIVRDIHAEGDGKAKALIQAFDFAEKWKELCKCLKWQPETPTSPILLQIYALNEGNQDKRTKLLAIKKLTDAWNDTGYDSSYALVALKEMCNLLEGVI